MFSPWDEHVVDCKCPQCLERQKAHEEMMKDMTWEKYGEGVKVIFDEACNMPKEALRNLFKNEDVPREGR